jgi:hypothetical protein
MGAESSRAALHVYYHSSQSLPESEAIARTTHKSMLARQVCTIFPYTYDTTHAGVLGCHLPVCVGFTFRNIYL